MKTLIRVQNALGEGMFTAPTSVYDIRSLFDLADRHREFPNAWSDMELFNFLSMRNMGKDSIFEGFRFAFKDLTQFERWVQRDEVARLKENGFKVVKIIATDTFESEHQAVFHIGSVVSTEDITDLFIS